MITEYDIVKTLVEKEGFKVGTEGVVVSVYSDKKACEVEMWDDEKYPVDVVTFSINEVEKIEET